MSSDKKKDPVSMEVCEAYRQGIQKEIQGLRELFEEKIKGIKTNIVVASSVSTVIILIVQFLLSLR